MSTPSASDGAAGADDPEDAERAAADIARHWDELGGPEGWLGEPEGDVRSVAAGYRRDFARGAVLWSLDTDGAARVAAVRPHTLRRYDNIGGAAGRLGFPIADTTSVLAHARVTRFVGGRIYWSRATGPRQLWGPILRRYLRRGAAAGRLGLPTTGVLHAGGASGARRSHFQHGRIYWSRGTGTREVWGPILRRYRRTGSAAGRLGLPTTGVLHAGGAPGARRSHFQHGRIYWSRHTGAHSVRAPLLHRYRLLHSAAGRMGLPTSEAFHVNQGLRQRFQGRQLLRDSRAHRTFIRMHYFARPHRVRARDVPYTWRSGCPVPPSRLRMVQIVHRRWNGDHVVGRLVVRASVVDTMRRVFRRAHHRGFPIRRMHPVDRWHGSDVRAMRHDNTSAFNCRHVTGNPYRMSQHSYGNAIDMNTVENPYVTGSRVYPAWAGSYLNRGWVRKGMIAPGDPLAGGLAREGWLWGARWSHPDYQHFSANGG